MITFNELLTDLELSFDKFYNAILKKINFTSVNPEEERLLRTEIYELFKSSLFEAISNAISSEDKLKLEEYLLLSPEENIFDVYFSMAAQNADADKILASVLAQTEEQIVSIYSKFK